MARYSEKFKDRAVARLLAPENAAIDVVAREVGIGSGTLERWRDDRIIITGTLPGVCYAEGMTSFLYAHGVRVFDYPRFAEPLRDRIRERAQEVPLGQCRGNSSDFACSE